MSRPLLELSVRSYSIPERDHSSALTADSMASIWAVFTKFKDNLKNEHRLENFSWRLWHHSKLKQEPSVPALAGSSNKVGGISYPPKKQQQQQQQQTLPPSSPSHGLPELYSSPSCSFRDNDDSKRSRELQQERTAYARPHARIGAGNSRRGISNDEGIFISKQDLFVMKQHCPFSAIADADAASPPEWFSDDDDDDDETVVDEEFQKRPLPQAPQQRTSLLSSMLQQQQQQQPIAAQSSSSSIPPRPATTRQGAVFLPEFNLLSESLRYCVDWERRQNGFRGGVVPYHLSYAADDNTSWSDTATFIPSLPSSANHNPQHQSISPQPSILAHQQPPPPPPMSWTEPFQGW